jgi:large subunit ribosomal protein L15
MSLSLHTLKPAAGSTKRRKRVGRGNSSGHGTYSTRGQKGQKARSGGKKGLTKKAIHSLIFHLPKKRGFRSLQPKMATVALEDLVRLFPEGAQINQERLVKVGLIRGSAKGVRVVGNIKLNKKFIVRAHGFSTAAARAILAAGGHVVQL